MSTKRTINRWVMLVILSAATGLLYQLPYLRYSYYDAMLEAFGYSNVQLGNLMSVYGLGSVICYVIGGVVADRFADKYLLMLGQVLTALGGFLFATFPSYPISLAISFFWAFCGALVFWPAVINYIKTLGSDSEQGRIYGLFEGLRGFITTVLGLGIVALFNYYASQSMGLRAVIICYAVINLVFGIMTFIFVPYEKKSSVNESGQKVSVVQNFLIAIKLPAAWTITISIFCTMTCFICLGYMTPYLTGVMGATVAFAATIGTIRTWGLQIVGGAGGGVIADKIRSSSLTMTFAFIVIAAGFALYMILPTNRSMLVIATILMFAFGVAIYVNRGVYFATMSEAGVPDSLGGTVVGFASALGFLPDAFMYTIIGNWLDKYDTVTGYRMIFATGAISGLIGMAVCFMMYRNLKKSRSVENG